MEIAKHRIEYRGLREEFHLYPVGDVHLGSAGCDEAKFEATIDMITADDHALVVFMGDLIEGILHDDKRWDTRAVATWCFEPQNRANIAIAQRDRLFASLSRIPRNRILGILSGNHEDTVRRVHHLDITLDLARELHVPYLGDEAFIKLTFHLHGTTIRSFDLFVTHGHGGGRKVGAKANKIVDVGAYLTSDITIMGHVHDKCVVHSPRLGLDRVGNLVSQDRLCVLSGCFLKTYEKGVPSYAARALYAPAAMGCPVIHITPRTRELRATV